MPLLHNIKKLYYYNWLHFATCFGRYTAIKSLSLKVFNVNNGIPLEKANE